MARTRAHRKYQLTINNPLEHDFSHEVIKSTLSTFTGCLYWCLCDEIGEQGTPHTHVYALFRNPVEFDTIHRRFYGAHIEPVRGSNQENRDYIRKEGRYLNDPKHETNLPDTFEESGELPPETTRRETQSAEVLEMIRSGASNEEILSAFPTQMTHLKSIDSTRQTLLEAEYRNRFRSLKVYYLFGKTGVGKTRFVMEKYGYDKVYRVTNYAHPFDSYQGQPVILFEEFRSDLPLKDMLKYLDGYPLMLPCRYGDKAACYETVYLVSNIAFNQQYPRIQLDEPESWAAFRRRFDSGGVYEMIMTGLFLTPFGGTVTDPEETEGGGC